MVPTVVSADVPFAEWIVRFDRLGTAYRLPLAEVERLGGLAVPFRHFVRCDDYPRWPYAERAVLIEP
jgi:hypothetical protein